MSTRPVEILCIGFGDMVLRSRIVAILSACSSRDSGRMKRRRDDAKEANR